MMKSWCVFTVVFLIRPWRTLCGNSLLRYFLFAGGSNRIQYPISTLITEHLGAAAKIQKTIYFSFCDGFVNGKSATSLLSETFTLLRC